MRWALGVKGSPYVHACSKLSSAGSHTRLDLIGSRYVLDVRTLNKGIYKSTVMHLAIISSNIYLFYVTGRSQ
jgi:hypothetical protein